MFLDNNSKGKNIMKWFHQKYGSDVRWSTNFIKLFDFLKFCHLECTWPGWSNNRLHNFWTKLSKFSKKTLYFLDYIKQKPTIVILGTWVTQENSSPVAHEKCCHSALLKTQWFIRGHKNMFWGVSICQKKTIPEKNFIVMTGYSAGKSFSNFSCMFLNPNSFLQFEF